MDQDSITHSIKNEDQTSETQGTVIHHSINRILVISFGLLQIGYSYGLFFFEKTNDNVSKYQIIIVYSWLIPLGGIIGSLIVIPFEKKSRRLLLHFANLIIILASGIVYLIRDSFFKTILKSLFF